MAQWWNNDPVYQGQSSNKWWENDPVFKTPTPPRRPESAQVAEAPQAEAPSFTETMAQPPVAYDPMTGMPIPAAPSVENKPDLTTIPGVAYYSGAANLGSQDPADVAALQRSLDAIAKREAERAKNPTKFSQIEKEKGFIAAVQEDPGGFAKETGQNALEGVVPMGAAIAGTMAGGPAGGAAVGAFSFGADAYARALIDQTRKRGGDLGDAEQFNAIYMKNKADIDAAAMKEAGISAAQGALYSMIPGGGGLKGMLGRVGVAYPSIGITGSGAKRMVNGEEPATGEEVLKEYLQGVATGLPFEAPGLLPNGGGRPKGPPSNRLLEGPQGGGRGPEGGAPPEGGPAGGGAADQPQARNQTVTEAEILKGGQFSADDIAIMSPQERAATARDLAQQGVKPESLTTDEYNQIFKPRTNVSEEISASNKKKETEDRMTRQEIETKNEFFAVLKGDGLSAQEIGQLSWPEVAERVRDIRRRKADKPISLTPEEKIELNLPLTKADQKALDKKTPPTTPPAGVEGRGPETPPASASQEETGTTTTATTEKPATGLDALSEQIRRQKANEERGGRPIDDVVNELPRGKDGNPDLGVLQDEIKKRTPKGEGNTPWENLTPSVQDDIIKGLQSLRPPVPEQTTAPTETPSVEEPTAGTKPTAEEPPIGGKKRPAAEEEVPPPQTPTGKKPTAEPETAPVEHAFTFKTSKGSEYEMTTDGKTIRNKAPRPEHPGDEGIKPQSEKTVFLDRNGANALAPPDNKEWAIVDHNDGTATLVTKNPDGKWGASPSQSKVPYTNTPEIGKYPLELWKGEKTKVVDANGNVPSFFTTTHFGNEIVSVNQYAEMPEQQKPQGGKGETTTPEEAAAPEETKPKEEEAVTPPTPPSEEEKPKPKEEEAAPPATQGQHTVDYDFFGPNATKIDNIAGMAIGLLKEIPRRYVIPDFQNYKNFKSLLTDKSQTGYPKLKNATNKEIQEGIELAIVILARKIALNDPSLPNGLKRDTPQGKFDLMLKIYEGHPKLTDRTSESIANQAYSTPIPLAYVASRLAGVNWDKSVLEPTAGNGALVIEANPEHTKVNEINRLRRDNLKAIGFDPTNKDASDKDFVSGNFNVVIANPPFGPVKGEGGDNKVFDMGFIQPNYKTKEIDHAISLTSLDHMDANGNAVLIIGSVHPMAVTDQARSEGYNSKAKREFFKTLYDNYNVTDHFTVAGKLYERQGAAWPVDVIVIKGKGKSALPLPAVKVPPLLTSWEQIKEKIPNESEATTVSAPTKPVSETGGEGATAGTEPSGQPNVQGGNPVGKPKTKTPRGVRGKSNTEQPGSGLGIETGEPEEGIEGPKSERFNQLTTPKRRDVKHEEETETQLPYTPKAKQSAGLGTLAPSNMRSSMEYALDDLEDKRGDIDAFVADRLKYKPDELEKYFSGEQIDALALAINNLEKGAGFIIGDQTGIGKGRINAGIIRYALINKLTPIFVTEKDNLYKDMWRDMSNEEGIGLPKYLGRDPNVLITDLNKTIDLDEDANGKKIRSAANINAIYNSSIESGKLSGYDIIFTTYSQMQTVKGESPLRRKFLENIASNSILILDESHNAGGGGARERKETDELNRAEFVRDLAQKSQGTFYSSATFAKRPDVMDLYAKTDIGLAVEDISKLPDLLARGGVPLMSVLSSTLAKAGQYMRRERTFAGVKYDAKLFDVNQEVYNDFSKSMMDINEFSKLVNEAAKDIKTKLKAEASAMSHDGSTGGAGAESTNFTSIMHNLINQLLLSMKAKPAIEASLKAIKDGQKPVLTVSNTMETFLKTTASDLGLSMGDVVQMDFGHLLLRYLERTRTLTLKKAFAKKGEKGTKHYLTDEELGPVGVAAYNKAKTLIANIDFGDLPISPIDYIRHGLEKKGYKVGEITGRQVILNYGGDEKNIGVPVLASRPSTATTARGKNKAISEFNNGSMDAIIINKSGSTGLSLHAKQGFKDVRQRHMIIVQPNENIDTHMQTLGRVHRTGQVIVPEYTQMIANIPAEKRPAAVLAKKMASLNAITTSARKSALTAENVPDFLNEYGDKIAAQFLKDNVELQDILGINIDDENTTTEDLKDLMRKLTGRIPLLNIDQQKEIYDTLESRYADYMQQLELAGGSALETKRLDLDAKLIESSTAREATGDSPFTGAVIYGLYEVNRMGSPIRARDAINHVLTAQKYKEETSDIDTVDDEEALKKLDFMFRERHREMVNQAKTEFNAYERKVISSTEGSDKQSKQGEKLTIFRRSFDGLSELLVPGQRIRVTLPSGGTGQVLVANVGRSGKSNNPLVPSDWRVSLVMPIPRRIVTIPFSQLQIGGDYGEKVVVDKLYREDSAKSFVEMCDRLATAGSREERVIITGNILSGYELADGAGQIINFTKDDGKIETGILLGQNIKSLKDASSGLYETIKTPKELKEVMSWNPKKLIAGGDEASVIIKEERGYFIVTVSAAKSKGGKYYLDKKLLSLMGSGFNSSGGGRMESGYLRADRPEIDEIFQRIIDLGAKFEKPVDLKPTSYSVLRPALKTETAHVIPEAYKEFEGIIKRTLGEKARVEFVDQIKITDAQAGMDSGGELDDLASGSHDRLTNIIYLATSLEHGASLPDATYHEAWHSLEDKLTPAERKAIADARPENNRLVAQYYGVPVEKIEALSTSEQDAYAMGMFGAKADDQIRNVAMGRASYEVFGKVWLTYRRFRNVVNKLFGKKSMDSIFNDFYVGGMADRLDMEADVMADKMGVKTSDLAYMALRQKKKVQPSYEVHEDTLKSELLYGLVNKYNDISMIQRAIEKARGSKLPETMDVEMATSLFNNRVIARQEQVWDKELQPLLDEMAKLKLNEDDLARFLYARHAPERNAKMAKRDPVRFPHGGSGMENDDAEAILDDFKSRGLYKTLSILDRDYIRPLIENDLNERLSAGLLTQDQYDEYTKPYDEGGYDFYVPLRGYAEQDADAKENISRLGRGFSVSGKEYKAAMGRKSEAYNPFQNLIQQRMDGIVRQEKNRVDRALYLLIKNHPNPDFAEILDSKNMPMVKYIAADGTVRQRPDTSIYRAEVTIPFKISGESRYIVFNDENPAMVRLVKSLKNLPNDSPSKLAKFTFEIGRFMSKINTAWVPDFFLTNFPRDLQDAMIALYGTKEGFATNFMTELAGAGKIIAKAETVGGLSAQDKALYDEWVLSGGRLEYGGFENLDKVQSKISREMFKAFYDKKTVNEKIMNGMMESGRLTIAALEKTNQIFENTVRFAVYLAARKGGYTKGQAADLSLNATVNFQKKGAWMPGLNAIKPFLSAGVGGIRNFARFLMSKRFRRALYGMIFLAFLTGLLGVWMNDDDENEPGKNTYYTQVKGWERSKNVIIPIKNKDGGFYKFNLGFYINSAWNIGDYMAAVATGNMTPNEAAVEIAASAVDSFNPMSQGSFWSAILPWFVLPVVQLAVNKDSFGNRIHPEAGTKNAEKPASEQYSSKTPNWTVDLASWLNRMTGGDEFEKGKIDLYPGTIDYWAKSLAGQTGQFVQRTYKSINEGLEGIPTPFEESPLLRRLVTKSAGINEGAYYDKRKEIFAKEQLLNSAWEELHTSGSPAAERKVDQLTEELGMRTSGNSLVRKNSLPDIIRKNDQVLNDMRDTIANIKGDDTLSPLAKKKQITEIEDTMKEQMGATRYVINSMKNVEKSPLQRLKEAYSR